MARTLTSADLPERFARFAEAQVAAGRFPTIEDVVEAALESFRERAESEQLAGLRRDAVEAFAAFDHGEGIETTPDALMDSIDRELGLDA